MRKPVVCVHDVVNILEGSGHFVELLIYNVIMASDSAECLVKT